ncbi:ribosome-binding factor A [Candidatus Azambacteria bacterium]|nr:ribosome-binding factor A [Candidatus Azambacteria bacterium]
MNPRKEKISKLIKKEIGKILEEDIEWKENLLVTVNRAELNDNFSLAVIFISVFPDDGELEVQRILRTLLPRINILFRKSIPLRAFPKLEFQIEKIS